ncbi:MAG: hypothetical protein HQK57_00170 [Deltaproteobacteria bacterium]|nr:hypothetical protein [Deltaproteobacteria bacterium]MBF0507328.1 hypothetical protein [Deltaproteobacteria bacterium]MBF0524816.1 hypothetical protein [Deltaproteobacteria bacterium]
MDFLDDVGPFEFALFLAISEEMADEERERLLFEKGMFLPEDQDILSCIDESWDDEFPDDYLAD